MTNMTATGGLKIEILYNDAHDTYNSKIWKLIFQQEENY